MNEKKTKDLTFISDEVTSFPNISSPVEISEGWYNHLFNCIPPINYGAGWFICGEPHHHTWNDDGTVTAFYLACVKISGRSFAVYATRNSNKLDIIAHIKSAMYD